LRWRLFLENAPGCRAVFRDRDLVPPFLQPGLQDFAEHGIIVGDQHPVTGTARSLEVGRTCVRFTAANHRALVNRSADQISCQPFCTHRGCASYIGGLVPNFHPTFVYLLSPVSRIGHGVTCMLSSQNTHSEETGSLAPLIVLFCDTSSKPAWKEALWRVGDGPEDVEPHTLFVIRAWPGALV
jgi:hypothetical protein